MRLLFVLGLTLLFAVPALILKAVRTVSASIASPASPQAQADFVRIVRLSANDVVYKAHWKHHDPDWLMLLYRSGKSRRSVMVRQGDPLLLELRPE